MMIESDAPMTGRTCLVTGANSGIGLEISRGLAQQGAKVVMVARSPMRGQAARDDVAESTGNESVEVLFYDLGSQRHVHRLAAEVLERFAELHVLVNNAGLTLSDRILTEEGIEMTFAVNHLAPFLLTELLRERLIASAPARVVTVASDAHSGETMDFEDLSGEKGWSGWQAYGRSKLANILFTGELSRRFEGTGVTATCLHPGVVRTGFGRRGPRFIRVFQKIGGFLLLSPEKGAETAVFLASSPEVEGENGGYYVKRKLKEPSKAARDPEAARMLWDVSLRLTGLPTESGSG
jgi:NAD(P)-dependent dehydrogenase (short-subunit alcohol dehydrogenase family)